MRALSFLFAALLGIALAMIAPALAGPAATGGGMEPVTAPAAIAEQTDLAIDTAPEIELTQEPTEAPMEASVTVDLENSLMVELGLDGAA